MVLPLLFNLLPKNILSLSLSLSLSLTYTHTHLFFYSIYFQIFKQMKVSWLKLARAGQLELSGSYLPLTQKSAKLPYSSSNHLSFPPSLQRRS